MGKAEKKPVPKKERPVHYEPKIKFDGTFEDMVGLSLQGADEDVKKRDAAKKTKK